MPDLSKEYDRAFSSLAEVLAGRGGDDVRYGSIRIDLMTAVLDVFRAIVGDARREDILGRSLRVATPEGLIVLKLIAFRPQDQADIQGLIAANLGNLDLPRIGAWYRQVGETTDDRWRSFERMLAEARDAGALDPGGG